MSSSLLNEYFLVLPSRFGRVGACAGVGSKRAKENTIEDQTSKADALPQSPCNIVIGQQVDEAKVTLARQMRRDMTFGEARLWARLRGSALGMHFRRQQVIAGFIADFYCHEAALAVEVDGATHDAAYDAERDRVFAERGIAVMRFTNAQVRDEIGVVLYTIRQALRAKGDKPTEIA